MLELESGASDSLISEPITNGSVLLPYLPNLSGYSEPVPCPSSSVQDSWEYTTLAESKKNLYRSPIICWVLSVSSLQPLSGAVWWSYSNIKLSESKMLPKSHVILELEPTSGGRSGSDMNYCCLLKASWLLINSVYRILWLWCCHGHFHYVATRPWRKVEKLELKASILAFIEFDLPGCFLHLESLDS